jgi:hypothetical protein
MSSKLSRRDFGRKATSALAGSALSSFALPADADPAPVSQAQKDGLPGTPASAQQPANPDIPEHIRAEVESKYAHMIARYGERLDAEQRSRARVVLEGHVRMLEAIRQVTLENDDPPASVLKLVTS